MRLRLLFALLLSFSFLPDAPAQMAPPAGPIVRSINIQYVGPETISRQRVMANLKTKVGDP